MQKNPSQPVQSIFTVDVEDWYHILDVPSAPPMGAWQNLPSCVEKNFLTLLDIFDESNSKVTCFFLGWIAERYPQLVREAVQRGHEIASHGFAHRLVFQMTPEEFREDALMSRKLLEDLSGAAVRGYRAAGFSTTEAAPWFFDELIAAGYAYDSSIFPAKRGHGGWDASPLGPYTTVASAGEIAEFPISVASVLGQRMCFSGGGYLRLFPYPVISRMAARIESAGRPVIFYIHPREIDPQHPRLKMNAYRRFKSYVNLDSTEGKVRRILGEFSCGTFAEYMDSHGLPRRLAAESQFFKSPSPEATSASGKFVSPRDVAPEGKTQPCD
ncbi:MAG TPA: XrtA system polysaccharide deacetylase [Candidatus Acidoferrales bacterium]|nr:XrtA system polysaccharide deacetylase [Candidatus Acidoferrales bacterium]